jgi:hypothetical protein
MVMPCSLRPVVRGRGNVLAADGNVLAAAYVACASVDRSIDRSIDRSRNARVWASAKRFRSVETAYSAIIVTNHGGGGKPSRRRHRRVCVWRWLCFLIVGRGALCSSGEWPPCGTGWRCC